ncbi:hypothetical protein [Ancylobacter terrae]|uniref:hypothetical protein n=1 Tax=Ancylobacter sp. sgz301288 TaxID=3342077 RepID=UPI00385DEDA9
MDRMVRQSDEASFNAWLERSFHVTAAHFLSSAARLCQCAVNPSGLLALEQKALC